MSNFGTYSKNIIDLPGGIIGRITSPETKVVSNTGDITVNLQAAIDSYKDKIISDIVTIELPDGAYGSISIKDLMFTSSGKVKVIPTNVRGHDFATYMNYAYHDYSYNDASQATYLGKGTTTVSLSSATITIAMSITNPNFVTAGVVAGDKVLVGTVEYVVQSVSSNTVTFTTTPSAFSSNIKNITFLGKTSISSIVISNTTENRTVSNVEIHSIHTLTGYINSTATFYGGRIRTLYSGAGHTKVTLLDKKATVHSISLSDKATASLYGIFITLGIITYNMWVGYLDASSTIIATVNNLVVNLQGQGIVDLGDAKIHVDFNSIAYYIIRLSSSGGNIDSSYLEMYNHNTSRNGIAYLGQNGGHCDFYNAVFSNLDKGIVSTSGNSTYSNGATFTNVNTNRTPATSGAIGNDGGMNSFN